MDLSSAKSTIQDKDNLIEKLKSTLESITEQFHLVQRQLGELETAYEFSEQEKDDLKVQLSAAERQINELRYLQRFSEALHKYHDMKCSFLSGHDHIFCYVVNFQELAGWWFGFFFHTSFSRFDIVM